MARAFLILFACVAVIAQVLGCSPVPQEQLRAYADTFDAADEAGRALYGTLDAAVAQASRLQSGAARIDCGPRKPAPACFDPVDFLPASERPLDPDIAARVAVFETVGAYNEALVALATGQTGEALQHRLDTLSALAGTAVQLAGTAVAGPLAPLLTGPLLGSFRTLATEVEGIRANAVARQSILSERGTIEDAIDALIADTPDVYVLYLRAQGNIATSVEGAPFSDRSLAEFQRIPDFHSALGAYVVLLAETRQSQDALVAAVEAGGDPAQQVGIALDQALKVRIAAAAFRQAIEALGN